MEKRSRDGHDVPALRNRPRLRPELTGYWNAFIELHSRRSIGYSANPIPLTEILAYLELMEVDDPEERRDYVQFVTFLDGEWLAWSREKQQSGESDAKSQGSN